MHIRTTMAVAGLTLAALAAIPVQAQPEPSEPSEPCTGPLRLTGQGYTHNGVHYDQMPSDLQAGSELTAHLRLEGCGKKEITLVSYEAGSDTSLSAQTLFDVETRVLAQGTHDLTVTVPPCFAHVALAYGAAIEQFTPPNGTYHGEGRIIAAVVAHVDCGDVPAQKVEVCPPRIDARAQADGTIELTWNATAGAAAHALYRAEGDGDLKLLQQFDGTANGTVDATAKGGVAYTYELVAKTELAMEPCASVQVGSVPNFPTAMGGFLAIGIGAAGYAVLRRRS